MSINTAVVTFILQFVFVVHCLVSFIKISINPSVYFIMIFYLEAHGHTNYVAVFVAVPKSSLNPAPLIVIMLLLLCLFFLACTGVNINFRELNKYIQLLRM